MLKTIDINRTTGQQTGYCFVTGSLSICKTLRAHRIRQHTRAINFQSISKHPQAYFAPGHRIITVRYRIHQGLKYRQHGVLRLVFTATTFVLGGGNFHIAPYKRASLYNLLIQWDRNIQRILLVGSISTWQYIIAPISNRLHKGSWQKAFRVSASHKQASNSRPDYTLFVF